MTELTYSRVGDYCLPNISLPEQNNCPVGKYGSLRKTYLKTHRKVVYTNLLTAGILHDHLTEIDAQADNKLELIMKQMAQSQGITENLKATNQMAWVGAMNNIKSCAEEIVIKEIVYA